MTGWIVPLSVILVILVMVCIAWRAQPKSPIHQKAVPTQAPAVPDSTCPLAIPTKFGPKAGCRHDLCCDSLCPSLSQYYNPLTNTCMERPVMPYGYGLAGGPCLVDFQDCAANPPSVPGPDLGLPREEHKPCDKLCDRFGGTLYYTGFTGVAAMKPSFIPSTYDGFQSFMGSQYASDNYVSSATAFSGGI